MRNYDPVKDIAVEVRAELKKRFPACKFSVTSDYNSLTVALMVAPESPYASGLKEAYDQLNHYYLDNYLPDAFRRPGSWDGAERLTPAAVAMLKEVTAIANKKNWDESDSMVDYFHCHYYFSLHIGKWDKPFVVK